MTPPAKQPITALTSGVVQAPPPTLKDVPSTEALKAAMKQFGENEED